MWFSSSSAFAVGDFHGDMAAALENTIGATLGAGAKTLHRHALVDKDRRHLEFVDIRTLVVLGVCNR
jgi:hypothetical protein